MINSIERNKLRIKRHLRTRKKISGTSEIPRLYIFRSLKTIYANIVDDDKGATIASASILAKNYRDNLMISFSKNFPNYDWENNSGYGTKKHIEGIHTHGITKWHRKTFGDICRNANIIEIPETI